MRLVPFDPRLPYRSLPSPRRLLCRPHRHSPIDVVVQIVLREVLILNIKLDKFLADLVDVQAFDIPRISQDVFAKMYIVKENLSCDLVPGLTRPPHSGRPSASKRHDMLDKSLNFLRHLL